MNALRRVIDRILMVLFILMFASAITVLIYEVVRQHFERDHMAASEGITSALYRGKMIQAARKQIR